MIPRDYVQHVNDRSSLVATNSRAVLLPSRCSYAVSSFWTIIDGTIGLPNPLPGVSAVWSIHPGSTGDNDHIELTVYLADKRGIPRRDLLPVASDAVC